MSRFAIIVAFDVVQDDVPEPGLPLTGQARSEADVHLPVDEAVNQITHSICISKTVFRP